MKNKTIAIITARGGSKRIPKKNIKLFCDEPIINYSIKAALESDLFDDVMVSTDSEEIAEVAKKAGASVPFMRSEKTSGDFATTADVLEEVFTKYREMGKDYLYACCIYPTSPFITAKKLKEGFELLISKKASSVIPVVRFSYPPQRAFIIKDEKLLYKWPENYSKRSQDLEPFYHDSGQFYFYNIKDFFDKENTASHTDIPLILSDLEVQDIDNFDDWQIAEIKYKLLKEKGLI